MKKLMFALLVAFGLSAVSHGATYYWGVAASADNQAYFNSGDTVYVLLASDWDASTATAASVASAAKSSGSYTKNGRKNEWKIDETGFSYGAEGTSPLDVVMVQVNSSGEYFSWTETLAGNTSDNTNPTTTSYTAADIAAKSTAAGGYKPFGGGSAIPEPTSGLLMLVGLGALALRRRRA